MIRHAVVKAATKRLASTDRPLLSRPMKRPAFSIALAAAAFGFGACEKHSSADLPEHYLHKGSHHDEAAAGHEGAPAHEEKAKAPAAEHKG